MRFIYTHEKSRIVVDVVDEVAAAESFVEIVKKFWPEKIGVRWHREAEVEQAIKEFETALVRSTSIEETKGT